jgi:hypothetical protein
LFKRASCRQKKQRPMFLLFDCDSMRAINA